MVAYLIQLKANKAIKKCLLPSKKNKKNFFSILSQETKNFPSILIRKLLALLVCILVCNATMLTMYIAKGCCWKFRHVIKQRVKTGNKSSRNVHYSIQIHLLLDVVSARLHVTNRQRHLLFFILSSTSWTTYIYCAQCIFVLICKRAKHTASIALQDLVLWLHPCHTNLYLILWSWSLALYFLYLEKLKRNTLLLFASFLQSLVLLTVV